MTGSQITRVAHNVMLNRYVKSAPDYTGPAIFRIGRGTTNPTTADTDLEADIPINNTESVDACDATTGWTDSADMTVSLNNSTYKVGTGSLNLTKDGTGSADASTSKTTTNVSDFSSKRLELFLYIADATVYGQLATSNCLTIRFGTDSSNYYVWTRDKADLAVGWNYIRNMTSSNADSSTGSPGTSNMDYTFVQMTATASGQTWAAGKIIMDDIRVTSTDDLTLDFVSGYPSIDESTIQVTYRSILTINDALGQSVSELGLFNSDSPRKLLARATHTPIDKDSDTQIIYVQKDAVS